MLGLFADAGERARDGLRRFELLARDGREPADAFGRGLPDASRRRELLATRGRLGGGPPRCCSSTSAAASPAGAFTSSGSVDATSPSAGVSSSSVAGSLSVGAGGASAVSVSSCSSTARRAHRGDRLAHAVSHRLRGVRSCGDEALVGLGDLLGGRVRERLLLLVESPPASCSCRPAAPRRRARG